MNILSIDFDIIMYPCIKLYNNYTNGGENPTIIWDMLFKEYGIDGALKYDATVLIDIAKLIQRSVKNGAKLIPIINHEDMVTYLKKNNSLIKNSLNVVNIDFHHDIYYDESNIIATKYFDECTCANWLGYLLTHEYLNSGLWVKAPNSDLCNISTDKVNNIDLIQTESIRNIKNLTNDYDYVFFCLSPQWVPYQYEHLYNLLCELNTEEEVNDEQQD